MKVFRTNSVKIVSQFSCTVTVFQKLFRSHIGRICCKILTERFPIEVVTVCICRIYREYSFVTLEINKPFFFKSNEIKLYKCHCILALSCHSAGFGPKSTYWMISGEEFVISSEIGFPSWLENSTYTKSSAFRSSFIYILFSLAFFLIWPLSSCNSSIPSPVLK